MTSQDVRSDDLTKTAPAAPLVDNHGALPVIQILRAVAATLVVILHAEIEIGEIVHGAAIRLPLDLPIGVDIFFVISGFIMSLTTARQHHGPDAASHFLVRRVFRIFPLYWVFTTLMLVAMLVAPHAFSKPSVEFGHVVMSYLLIPHAHPAALVYEPVLRVGWTLIYELFFYGLFTVALLMPKKAGRIWMIGVLLILPLAGQLLNSKSDLVSLYTSTLLLEFLFGIFIADLLSASPRLRRWATAGLVVAAVAVATLHHWRPMTYDLRGLYAGLPAAAIVATALLVPARAFDNRVGRLLVALGGGSYALYLSHIFAIGAVKAVAAKLFTVTPLGGLALTFVATVASIIAAQAIYEWLERPMLRIAKRLEQWIFRRSPPRPTKPALEPRA